MGRKKQNGKRSKKRGKGRSGPRKQDTVAPRERKAAPIGKKPSQHEKAPRGRAVVLFSRAFGRLVAVISLIAAFIAIWSFVFHSYDLPDKGHHGRIVLPDGKNVMHEKFQVVFGNSSFTANSKDDGVFLPFGTRSPVAIKPTTASGIQVSCEVYSSDGRIVAVMKDNEWEINPNNYFRRNFHDNALEVVDQQNRPVFQVVLEPPNVVRVQGLFVVGTGRAEALSEVRYSLSLMELSEGTVAVSSHSGLSIFPKGFAGSADEISQALDEAKVWFKYPYEIYPGRMRE